MRNATHTCQGMRLLQAANAKGNGSSPTGKEKAGDSSFSDGVIMFLHRSFWKPFLQVGSLLPYPFQRAPTSCLFLVGALFEPYGRLPAFKLFISKGL